MRRAIFPLILMTGAIIIVVGMIVGLVRGARADRCASELVSHVKDRVFLAQVIKSPTLPDDLIKAHQVELGFVRPLDSDTARVGLFVRTTSTATHASVLVLTLERGDEDACVFVRDYESGAFSR